MEISKLKNDILAGRDIFEKLTNEQRPRWAKGVLLNFADYVDNIPSEISELILLINDKERWREAHGQFSKIRQFSLKHKILNQKDICY